MDVNERCWLLTDLAREEGFFCLLWDDQESAAQETLSKDNTEHYRALLDTLPWTWTSCCADSWHVMFTSTPTSRCGREPRYAQCSLETSSPIYMSGGYA